MSLLFRHAPTRAWLCVAGQLTIAGPSHSADVVVMYTCLESDELHKVQWLEGQMMHTILRTRLELMHTI